MSVSSASAAAHSPHKLCPHENTCGSASGSREYSASHAGQQGMPLPLVGRDRTAAGEDESIEGIEGQILG